jgi:hypothetical protein
MIQKVSQQNTSIYNGIKKNKILKNKHNQGGKRHAENDKTLMKEIKEYTNKWKDFSCL